MPKTIGLPPAQLEYLSLLIGSAEAVATLIHCDNAFDATVSRAAAGAVSEVLRKAQSILKGASHD